LKLKKTIRKVLVVTGWSLVGCGMIVLLAAAKRKQQHHYCRKVVVSIQGDKFYFDKSDILKELQSGSNSSLIHKPVSDFDLSILEKRLENLSWIKDAELYFDSKDVLHASVSEREPIARVFTTSGATFYLDSAGKRLPLLNKVSARVPVVTNFMAAKRLNGADSALLKDVKELVAYISAYDFWKAQIAQIDITPARTFELIPVVGNHTIRLGTAENFQEKLQRLFLFYQQVLSKTGFDKYAIIDVQYDGQVVASQKGTASAVDSVQLQKNIQELVERARMQQFNDSLATVQKVEAMKVDSSTSQTIKTKAVIENKTPVIKAKPAAAKPKVTLKPVAKKAVEKPGKPKAVMKKKNEY
jgi:cell division protein FtsQ